MTMAQLTCRPDCPICHGDGFYAKPYKDINDPNFGKLFVCPNIEKRFWPQEFGIDRDEAPELNWDLFLKTKSFKQMKALFDKLLMQGYGWAYVYGPPGVGKTRTAKAAVVRARYQYHIESKYTLHSSMLNYLRSSYDTDSGQTAYERRLKELSMIPCLVIDEVGRDRATQFGVSVLSDLLNVRYEGALRRKTITIMLSNFAPDAILDDYQIDRVKDKRFDLLQLEGDSIRKHLTYEQASILEDEPDWWQKIGG